MCASPQISNCQKHSDDMLLFVLPPFLLLLLQIRGEESEPAIRQADGTLELGYCFGVDYIVAYKHGPNGNRLLGNSSSDAFPVSLPSDLRDRVHLSDRNQLLGLQIRQLVPSDSGVYLRECWRNRTRVSRRLQALIVCEDATEPEKVIVNDTNDWTELRCNASGLTPATSIRWYFDVEPSSRIQLFLDTAVSPEPLLNEIRGAVTVQNDGQSLLLRNSLVKQKQQFYCVVSDGNSCLGFQNMYQPIHSERRTIFASAGDKVQLSCPLESPNQLWETPLGNINASHVANDQMRISSKPGDFTLLIPAASYQHAGEYSCVAAALDLQYSLSLCPRVALKEKTRSAGADVLLDCDVGREAPKRVLWFREESSGGSKLIYDSNDDSVEVPEDLRGRTSLAKGQFSLTLADARGGDGGLYWCVALGESEPADSDYIYDYDDEYSEYADGQYWYETPRCIFKQENKLILAGKTSAASELALTAVAMALVMLGLVVAVVVIKRTNNIQRRKKGGVKSRRDYDDVKVNVECTQKLNPT